MNRVNHIPVGTIVTGRRNGNLILVCTYSRSKTKSIERQDKPTSSARSRRDHFQIARVDGATLAV